MMAEYQVRAGVHHGVSMLEDALRRNRNQLGTPVRRDDKEIHLGPQCLDFSRHLVSLGQR